MLSHINLKLYYEMMFEMSRQQVFDLKSLEDMYPFERDIYAHMLKDAIAAENRGQQDG
jgi:hypothetical protein